MQPTAVLAQFPAREVFEDHVLPPRVGLEVIQRDDAGVLMHRAEYFRLTLGGAGILLRGYNGQGDVTAALGVPGEVGLLALTLSKQPAHPVTTGIHRARSQSLPRRPCRGRTPGHSQGTPLNSGIWAGFAAGLRPTVRGLDAGHRTTSIASRENHAPSGLVHRSDMPSSRHPCPRLDVSVVVSPPRPVDPRGGR